MSKLSKVERKGKLIPAVVFVGCLRARGSEGKLEFFALLLLAKQELKACKNIQIPVVQSK